MITFIDLNGSERKLGNVPKSEVMNRESNGSNTAGKHIAIGTTRESNDDNVSNAIPAHVVGVPGVMMQELPASAHAIWANTAASSNPASFSLLLLFVIFIFLSLRLTFV